MKRALFFLLMGVILMSCSRDGNEPSILNPLDPEDMLPKDTFFSVFVGNGIGMEVILSRDGIKIDSTKVNRVNQNALASFTFSRKFGEVDIHLKVPFSIFGDEFAGKEFTWENVGSSDVTEDFNITANIIAIHSSNKLEKMTIDGEEKPLIELGDGIYAYRLCRSSLPTEVRFYKNATEYSFRAQQHWEGGHLVVKL